jgi:nucleoside-diphosphate-sugar epimerase
MVWGATDVEDIAGLAVAFLERGPANRGFDVHLPGGVTAAAIGQAVEAVTGRTVAYQAAPSSRAAVEPYPISDAHKALYAELFDYFRANEYLGDPLPITEAVGDFAYGTIEDFVARELFPVNAASV